MNRTAFVLLLLAPLAVYAVRQLMHPDRIARIRHRRRIRKALP